MSRVRVNFISASNEYYKFFIPLNNKTFHKIKIYYLYRIDKITSCSILKEARMLNKNKKTVINSGYLFLNHM